MGLSTPQVGSLFQFLRSSNIIPKKEFSTPSPGNVTPAKLSQFVAELYENPKIINLPDRWLKTLNAWLDKLVAKKVFNPIEPTTIEK